MKSKQKGFRFSERETKMLAQLAKEQGMNESEYIKSKLFDNNPDLSEEGIKYICPSFLKHSYFLAFSQIRIQFLLEKILLNHENMNLEEFDKFRKEDKQKIEKILSELGYKKIQNNKNE